jgi:DNA-binding NarL/FixJ family response regulator
MRCAPLIRGRPFFDAHHVCNVTSQRSPYRRHSKRAPRAGGAEVSGPAATSADAHRLASEQAPDAALVDFSLRGGERAHGLIDRLHDEGVYVIVTSGYAVLPVMPRHAAAILKKPLSEAQLLESLSRVVARKA